MGATKMNGTIKVFKREYMWGVILGSDSIDYQFNGNNIVDPALLEMLQNSQTKNVLGIAVSYKSSKYRNKNGETKNIAVNISALHDTILPGAAKAPVCPDSSSENQNPSIPSDVKALVCQVLFQEQGNRGRYIWLSELVPLLESHDLFIDKYGYKKAKAFLHDLEFADVVSSEAQGADYIALNAELASAYLNEALAHTTMASLPAEDSDSLETAPVLPKNTASKEAPAAELCGTSGNNEKGSNRKALLPIKEQIAYMENKGVRFEAMSKDEAEFYLRNRANYFRVRAFRSGFERFARGENTGKYRNLDFAWLVDLVEIDDSFRSIMRDLTSDIEHAARLIILEEVEAHESEPYGIVQDFLESGLGAKTRNLLNSKRKALENNELDPFTAGLVRRYSRNNEYPIWAFLELIPFGSLCWFYGFVSNRYESEEPISKRIINQDRHIFQVVKKLRNACSHGNCILNCLHTIGNAYPENRCEANWHVKTFLKEIDDISDSALQRYLYDSRIYPIVTTLYAHQHYVEDESYQRACRQLTQLADRMAAYRVYCENRNNDAVFYAFSFLESVIRAAHGESGE